jgi:hypothetical protein
MRRIEEREYVMKRYRLLLAYGLAVLLITCALVILNSGAAPLRASPLADPGTQPARRTTSSPALVFILPASRTVTVGETFTLDVGISGVTNLGAFEFTLAYNPSVVTPTAATLGPFLGSTGLTNTVPPGAPLISAGQLTYGAYSYGGTSGPSGSGVLASLTFKARVPGASALHFRTDAVFAPVLADPHGSLLSAVAQDGSLNVVPASNPLYLPFIRR